MAAIDTFDWYIQPFLSSADEETKKFLMEERKYLLNLRSEDERQRFVEELIRKRTKID